MLVQNVGRVFRADFPTVMHFVDNDSIYQNHWYRAKKWYTKRNGSIIEYKCPIIVKEDPNKKDDSFADDWTKRKIMALQKTSDDINRQ